MIKCTCKYIFVFDVIMIPVDVFDVIMVIFVSPVPFLSILILSIFTTKKYLSGHFSFSLLSTH